MPLTQVHRFAAPHIPAAAAGDCLCPGYPPDADPDGHLSFYVYNLTGNPVSKTVHPYIIPRTMNATSPVTLHALY